MRTHDFNNNVETKKILMNSGIHRMQNGILESDIISLEQNSFFCVNIWKTPTWPLELQTLVYHMRPSIMQIIIFMEGPINVSSYCGIQTSGESAVVAETAYTTHTTSHLR